MGAYGSISRTGRTAVQGLRRFIKNASGVGQIVTCPQKSMYRKVELCTNRYRQVDFLYREGRDKRRVQKSRSVPSSFLFLVVRPGAPSSVLAPSSDARSP